MQGTAGRAHQLAHHVRADIEEIRLNGYGPAAFQPLIQAGQQTYGADRARREIDQRCTAAKRWITKSAGAVLEAAKRLDDQSNPGAWALGPTAP